MDAKTKFLNLKLAWKKANEVERLRIDEETKLLFESLTDEEKEEVFKTIDEDFAAMHKEIDEIKQVLDVRKKLTPILPIISISYLSKKYFHKTPQWFYHRLNGNKINGKPAKFSSKEIETLSIAVQDIAKQLSLVQL